MPFLGVELAQRPPRTCTCSAQISLGVRLLSALQALALVQRRFLWGCACSAPSKHLHLFSADCTCSAQISLGVRLLSALQELALVQRRFLWGCACSASSKHLHLFSADCTCSVQISLGVRLLSALQELALVQRRFFWGFACSAPSKNLHLFSADFFGGALAQRPPSTCTCSAQISLRVRLLSALQELALVQRRFLWGCACSAPSKHLHLFSADCTCSAQISLGVRLLSALQELALVQRRFLWGCACSAPSKHLHLFSADFFGGTLAQRPSRTCTCSAQISLGVRLLSALQELALVQRRFLWGYACSAPPKNSHLFSADFFWGALVPRPPRTCACSALPVVFLGKRLGISRLRHGLARRD